MKAITKPSIDEIETNVKKALRQGVYTIYDLMQTIGNKLNECIDWIMTNGATLAENEDERIEAETDRSDAEIERKTEFKGWQDLIADWKTIYNDKGEYILDISKTGFQIAVDGNIHLQGNSIDGTTQNDILFPAASTSSPGTLSIDDKKKLDAIVAPLSVSCCATENYNGLMSAQDKDYFDQIMDGWVYSKYGVELTREQDLYLKSATSETAGCMSADDYNTLQALKARVEGVVCTVDAGKYVDIEMYFNVGDEPFVQNLLDTDAVIEVQDSPQDYQEEMDVEANSGVLFPLNTMTESGYTNKRVRVQNNGTTQAKVLVKIK